MTAKYLVDTNVLVYAYDRSEPTKQRRALELLDRLTAAESLACSVQSLSEFFCAATRRIAAPLSLGVAARQIEIFIQSWSILDLTPLIVLEAARGTKVHRLSYGDAQIWASARLNQIGDVLTEDFQHGRTVEGVLFRNPFNPEVDLDRLA